MRRWSRPAASSAGSRFRFRRKTAFHRPPRPPAGDRPSARRRRPVFRSATACSTGRFPPERRKSAGRTGASPAREARRSSRPHRRRSAPSRPPRPRAPSSPAPPSATGTGRRAPAARYPPARPPRDPKAASRCARSARAPSPARRPPSSDASRPSRAAQRKSPARRKAASSAFGSASVAHPAPVRSSSRPVRHSRPCATHRFPTSPGWAARR